MLYISRCINYEFFVMNFIINMIYPYIIKDCAYVYVCVCMVMTVRDRVRQ